MIEFTVNKTDVDKVNQLLAKVSDGKRLLANCMRSVGQMVEGQLKDNLTNKILHVRTGALRASIGYMVYGEGENLVAKIGSGVRTGNRLPYANIHETGGIIRPRPENKTGYLWIPIRSGSDYAIQQGMSTKRISYSSKILRYIRVKQVTIPARRYMSITLEQVQDRIPQLVIDNLKAYLQRN